MYSFIAFLLTLCETGAALGAYLLQSKLVFDDVVVYGSPFFLAMNMLNADSALVDRNLLYIGFVAFHLIKYFIFFRAQTSEDRNMLRTAAIVLEAAYLGLSAYYLI